MIKKNIIEKIFKIHRSLAGKGNRQTLKILSDQTSKKIKIKFFKSGELYNGWQIPNEWNVKKAFISYKNKKIIDFKNNNLYLIANSISIDKYVNLKNLKKKIFTIKNYPSAIPYITNYYSKSFWGFSMEYKKYKKLKPGKYRVKIDVDTKKGMMNYGEAYIKGSSKKEIIFATYICHPQMANNEISGPIVNSNLLNLINKFSKKKKLRYSYRFLFLPETIGTIAILNKKLKMFKKNTLAVYVLTCLGTEKKFKLIESPYKNTVSEKIAKQVLNRHSSWESRSFLQRGSDERQWSSPNVSIDCCSIVTSKYGEYKEYHTSKDDLNFISYKALKRSANLFFKIFIEFEKSHFYFNKSIGEPKMDKFKIYPKISTKNQKKIVKSYMDVLSFCNGKNNEKSISEFTGLSFAKTCKILQFLFDKKLITNTIK
jgi:aminopeptidase-like protein